MERDDVPGVLAALRRRRERNEHALAKTMAETREVVVDAVALGMSESELHRLAGVNRMTIRSWLGK